MRGGSRFRLRIWLVRALDARCLLGGSMMIARGYSLCLRGLGHGALFARGMLAGCKDTCISISLQKSSQTTHGGRRISRTLPDFEPCAYFALVWSSPSLRYYSARSDRGTDPHRRQLMWALVWCCCAHHCSILTAS